MTTAVQQTDLQTYHIAAQVYSPILNEKRENEQAGQDRSQAAAGTTASHVDADGRFLLPDVRHGTSAWQPASELSASRCRRRQQNPIDCCMTTTSTYCLGSLGRPCHQQQRDQHLCQTHSEHSTDSLAMP